MSAFDDFLDALAHDVATHQTHPRAGWPAGVRAMSDAVKQAVRDGEIRADTIDASATSRGDQIMRELVRALRDLGRRDRR